MQSLEPGPYRRKAPLWFWAVTAMILSIAAMVRMTAIETRPLHSDESVNFLFFQSTGRNGYYQYSHENYHGPLFFYLLTGFIELFEVLFRLGLFYDHGDCVFGLRFVAIFFGLLTVATVVAFRRLEGECFAAVGAAFAAVSPSLVFFSRYAIHESLLVFLSLGLALSLLGWMRCRHPVLIYAAAFSTAGLVTTKETFGVAVFCIGLAALSCGGWREHFARLREQWGHVVTASVFSVLGVVGVFTGGFRWADGLREMVFALPQWIGRSSSDQGHVKPFRYYAVDVILTTEPYLYGAAVAIVLFWLLRIATKLAGTRVIDLARPHRHLLRFLAVWSLTALLVYSAIPYKTVWLVINITLPAGLLVAAALACVLESRPLRIPGGLLLIAGLAFAWQSMCRFNFTVAPIPYTNIAVAHAAPYGPENPFSYVHTEPGTIELAQRIISVWRQNQGIRVLIGLEGYFPLPYYLRRNADRTGYMKPTDIEETAKGYDILVLDYYRQHFENPAWEKAYVRLSDFAESYVYWRKGLLEDAGMAEQPTAGSAAQH